MSDVTALTCPNCGGSIDISDPKTEITKCPYCGTTLKLPEQPQPEPAVSITHFDETYVPPRALSRNSSNGARGWFVLAMIVAVIGIAIGIAAPLFSNSGGIFASFNLEEGVVPVLPAENGFPDLVALVKQGDEENSHLALLDGKTRQVRWQSSQTFSSDSERILPVPNGDLIYFSDGTNMMAFQMATGKVAWQQAMANGVDSGCKNCVRVVDGMLIVLSKDGTLQAFNALSGQPAWNIRLNTSPRELLLAGGQPALVDQDKNKNNFLYIYDAQTGKVTRQLGAGCKAAAGQANHPGLEDAYLSPDGQLAYIMYYTWGSGYPACAQQVNLADGNTLWTVSPKEGQSWPQAWFAAGVMVSDEGIFFYEENELSMIDAHTGELRSLFKEPRYRDVTPLVSQPRRVVVIAIPDYDSEAKELWGIDTASGNKVWTYKMQAKSIIDPWRVRLVSSGLAVVQCLGDPKVSLWEVLDPLTGASRVSMKISDQNYNFLEDAWTSSTAYLKIDNTLYAVDVKTGSVQYTWP